MVTVTVKHDGNISNLDALAAVHTAMRVGAWETKPLPEKRVYIGEKYVSVIETTDEELSVGELRDNPNNCVFDVAVL